MIPRHRVADQPDQQHHPGAEHRHGEALREQMVAAGIELLHHPRRRREHECGERRVLRSLRAVAEVGEAVSTRQRVRLRVVIDLVAEHRLGALGSIT